MVKEFHKTKVKIEKNPPPPPLVLTPEEFNQAEYDNLLREAKSSMRIAAGQGLFCTELFHIDNCDNYREPPESSRRRKNMQRVCDQLNKIGIRAYWMNDQRDFYEGTSVDEVHASWYPPKKPV